MSALRILHLSDTHVAGDGGRHYGVVDTAEHLQRALAHVQRLNIDLVVVSGDVSDDGSEESYRQIQDAVTGWAAGHGARAVFAMGNHDDRAGFRAVLGGGQPGADETVLGGDDPARPVASVAEHDGWRVVVLDSSVPGAGYGTLEPEQLQFLRDAIAAPSAHGTIVIVHHPPVRAQTDLLQALALDEYDARDFIEVVRASDVRVVLSGHYHHPIVEVVAGVPVVVAPGVTNVARAFEDPNEESALDAFGGTYIEIDGDHVRTVPFTEPLTPVEVVFHLDADVVAQVIRDAGRQG